MPIKPENRKLYPANWKEIRAEILSKADNCCEFCGIPNHLTIIRSQSGILWRLNRPATVGDTHCWNNGFDRIYLPAGDVKERPAIRVVLTIAHLDHDPTNNRRSNLRALCQRCHNRHDAAHRAENRKATLEQKKRQ